jgi:hypothetical protein
MQLRDWAGALQLMSGKQPAFCARHAFLDAFDALFEPRSGIGMLAVYSSTAHGDGVRLGKSRLLEQLLFRALRSGHVPVVQRKRRESAPPTVDGLLRELDDDVMRTSQHLGLSLSQDVIMGAIASAYRGKPINDSGAFQAVEPLVSGLQTAADAAAKADPGSTGARARLLGLQLLLRELRLNGLSGQAACRAIQHDLWEMARSFRARLTELRAIETAAGRPVPAWLSAPEAARAVLFLDNADLFEVSVLNGIYELVTPGGLGTADDPIPVVATFTYAGTTQLSVKQFVESAKASCRPLELAPFSPGEDLLVYQRVLLNPFNDKLFDKLGVSSATAFAVNPVELTTNDATAKATRAAQESEELLSVALEGRPDKLGRELYVAVASVRANQYFVEARDADVLKELGLT